MSQKAILGIKEITCLYCNKTQAISEKTYEKSNFICPNCYYIINNEIRLKIKTPKSKLDVEFIFMGDPRFPKINKKLIKLYVDLEDNNLKEWADNIIIEGNLSELKRIEVYTFHIKIFIGKKRYPIEYRLEAIGLFTSIIPIKIQRINLKESIVEVYYDGQLHFFRRIDCGHPPPHIRGLCRKCYQKEDYQRPEIKARIKKYHQEYYQRPEVKAKAKEHRNQPEIKAKLRKYQREYRERPELEEKVKKYNQKYHRKHYRRPEVKARKREQQREYYQRPEVKVKKKEYKQEYLKRPGVKERIKEQALEYSRRPYVKAKRKEYRKRIKARKYQREYYQRPEVKAKKKEYKQRPEVKARRKKHRNQPEVKAKLRKYHREYYHRPEVKAKAKEYYLRQKEKKKVKQ